MPRVSIVIPTHNRAEYLGAAIQSVINQTFQDFEIIVVDDASIDNTPDVVSRFDDSRITCVRFDRNRGGSAARNKGILASRGEYIAFLDDDDEWEAEKLQLQVDFLDQAPSEIGTIYSGYVMVDTISGEVLSERIPAMRGDLKDELLTGNCVGTTSTVLARRDCFDAAGLFDEDLPSFQDHDMWIRIAQTFHFEYIERPLVKYRVHVKKIWTNFEAMEKGMDRMLSKYGTSKLLRRSLSYSYLRLGVECMSAGETVRSRASLLKAIRLYPYEHRHYFNLILSFLGTASYRKSKELKDHLLSLLRNRFVRKAEDRG